VGVNRASHGVCMYIGRYVLLSGGLYV
jgi:hypothetical protein